MGNSKQPLKAQKRRLITRDKRGLRYPVQHVAAELGVDVQTLNRRCEASGFHLNGEGVTFREAFDALTAKSESESAHRRKKIAEAEAAEIDTLNKRGLFMFRANYESGIKDFSVQTKQKVLGAGYIPEDSRKRLVKELAEIKPSVAEPSHK